ncbi:MAG: signal peptidase I [Verrucomicrobiota bacterium]
MLDTKLVTAISVVAFVALSGCNKKRLRQASSSMEPTIKPNEIITIDKSAYRLSKPSRWDVIAFESPLSDDGQWLGRVVGLPGETLEISSGSILINGKKEALPSHLGIGAYEPPRTENLALGDLRPVTFPHKIGKGSYFVLGDNVSNALDSRYWGDLQGNKIIGQVTDK